MVPWCGIGRGNRAYYAMFYALLGLLATRQLGTSKHSGAISLFDCEFVKTGLFPRELSRALHLNFDRRQRYDYGEMIPLTAEIIEETLQEARMFVVAVETHLRAAGHLGDARGKVHGWRKGLGDLAPTGIGWEGEG